MLKMGSKTGHWVEIHEVIKDLCQSRVCSEQVTQKDLNLAWISSLNLGNCLPRLLFLLNIPRPCSVRAHPSSQNVLLSSIHLGNFQFSRVLFLCPSSTQSVQRTHPRAKQVHYCPVKFPPGKFLVTHPSFKAALHLPPSSSLDNCSHTSVPRCLTVTASPTGLQSLR